ncbi:MAG: hypothetical protein M3Q95_11020 [Bacteroidota bacterium]|nr:hypothetical protein [Bacteroidota bacterium]
MLELLIAILIALGYSVDRNATLEEIQKNPVSYEKAIQIQETGNYKEDDGGVVIIEIGGD